MQSILAQTNYQKQNYLIKVYKYLGRRMGILGPGEEKTIKHNILYCTAVFSYCSTIQYSTIHIFPKFLCSTALLTGPLFALYCTILILHYFSFVSLLILLLFQNFTILRHRTSSFASFYQHEKAGEHICSWGRTIRQI